MNQEMRRGAEWWAGKLNSLSTLRDFVPPDYEPLIGTPDRPLLAKGFPLLIAGDIGVGKSLLAIQAIRSLCLGIPFLGRFPVTKLLPGERLTLLTLDRSYAVTQRLLAATSNVLEQEFIDSKISVISDVEQSSIESDPYLLADIAEAGESKLLIIDGADKLTRNVVDHESGRRLADAVNSLLNRGVDLIMTSHLKKSQKQFNVDGKMSDIYGSMQLPAVVGSVVTLTARKKAGEDNTSSSNFHQVKTIKGEPHNGVLAHNHPNHTSGFFNGSVQDALDLIGSGTIEQLCELTDLAPQTVRDHLNRDKSRWYKVAGEHTKGGRTADVYHSKAIYIDGASTNDPEHPSTDSADVTHEHDSQGLESLQSQGEDIHGATTE